MLSATSLRRILHPRRCGASLLSTAPERTDTSKFAYSAPEETRNSGIQCVHDPWSNKGTGFTIPERDRLRIRGLVPPRTLTLAAQSEKIMAVVEAKRDELDRHAFLLDLLDRNETLYYRMLIDNLEKLAPIVYTPTVGLACQKFGSVFRRARGMYFSSQDKGQMGVMCHNWPRDDVEVVVVTDGSRILGLGDLGANGMGIPIGKLALYVAAGGIDPRKVLPVMLDLGTDNAGLQSDPWYLGMTHSRLRGDEYHAMVHEFVNSIHARWPHALIQFEDFSSDKAATILETYRNGHLCFNDDIQGTGAVVLGALLAAVRTQGEGSRLADQRIVICGAGSAGMGVAASLAAAMTGREGLTAAAAAERIWVVDQFGLMGASRAAGSLTAAQAFFARKDERVGGLRDGAALGDVVAGVKPTILLGFTGVGGAWKEDVVREMARHVERPIIFPLSNPTANAECSAEQAYAWTRGKAVFGGGSPFAAVALPDGGSVLPSQINNMFMFPCVKGAAPPARPTPSPPLPSPLTTHAHPCAPLPAAAWAFAPSPCGPGASPTTCFKRPRTRWRRW
jgi:malate dehydrogenase (oxaloacetate-decarboxylating)(NADP+)